MDAQVSSPPPTPSLADSAPTARDSFGVVPGLVWAFRIHDDGTADPMPIDAPIERHHDGWLWLHLNLADVRACQWLRSIELPAAATTMLLSRDRHQQLHAAGACVYGIFADLTRGIAGSNDEIRHLRFAMTEKLLVSGRHHALTSVDAARTSIERGERRLPSVAALLELIVEHLADGVDRIADDLANELDAIDDELAAGAIRVERQKLARVRRTSVKIHRQLTGLRMLFHRLEREGTQGVTPPLQLAASKLAQRLDGLDHSIVEMRDRAWLLQEEVTAGMAEETNRHLYILSILTTLFLPPTLVTGVFGMNTKGLPFTENEAAFLLASGLMFGSALAVYLIMRRIGVFKF